MVSDLGAVFKATKVVVVAHYSGLTVVQMQTLRRQMKQAGASVRVAKNRLAKIALEGSDIASIAPLLKGPTLMAFSGDPIAAPKAAVDFAKTHEQFVILGGAMGCAPESWACSWRRLRRSHNWSTPRPPRWPVSFRPMRARTEPTRQLPPEDFNLKFRTEDIESWLICKKL
jgi:hypothetical protein